MYLVRMLVSTILLSAMAAVPVLADSVFEDWNDGDLGGWQQNTSQTVIEVLPAGGVDDSGFLFSYETPSGFDIVGAVQQFEPYVGDYGGYGYSMMQCALKFFDGVFADARFRVRYLDSSPTMAGTYR